MNTRNSARGNLVNPGARGRSSRRSTSASRNNISIELQDSLPKTRPKVVHSPTTKTPSQKTKPSNDCQDPSNFDLQRTQSSNTLNFPTASNQAEKPVERTQSSSSLPASTPFHDIVIMDNQELSAHANVFVPLSGRVSDAVPNPVSNPQYQANLNQEINAPLISSNNNSNSNVGTPFDTLIALMEQSMRTTREEFRKELNSIRTSISQIGVTNPSNTFRPPESNYIHFNTPNSNSNRLSNIQCDDNNYVKLEKWKICYDGLGSVSDFLFKVETLCNRSKCSEEHLLSNFHVLLEGKAENWYWLFTRQNKNITFPMLRHALTKEFGHLESDHDVLLRMSLRKQQFKESYDDFHSAIISMNLRLQNPLPDSTLIEILKKNLNPNLRFLLFNADSRDVIQFRDTARRAEKVIKDTRFQNPSGTSRNVSEVEVLVTDSDESDPQVEAINYDKGRKFNNDYSGIQCWNCSSYGHSYIYCSEEIKNPFCFKCGNKGVLTPKCPKNHILGNRKMGELATGDIRPSHKPPSFN